MKLVLWSTVREFDEFSGFFTKLYDFEHLKFACEIFLD